MTIKLYLKMVTHKLDHKIKYRKWLKDVKKKTHEKMMTKINYKTNDKDDGGGGGNNDNSDDDTTTTTTNNMMIMMTMIQNE